MDFTVAAFTFSIFVAYLIDKYNAHRAMVDINNEWYRFCKTLIDQNTQSGYDRAREREIWAREREELVKLVPKKVD